MSGDRSFLGRWSRRKAALREGRPASEEPVKEARAPAAPEPAEPAVDEDALTDAELLDRYGLPDPETLVPGEGVAPFMRAGIPARLRRLALRRLWRLNPELTRHDGLTDYAEDYTDAATVMPDIRTVFEVGKGARAHLERLKASLEAEPPSGVDRIEEVESIEPEAPALEEPGEAAELETTEPDSMPEEPPARAPRRHMSFVVPDTTDGSFTLG